MGRRKVLGFARNLKANDPHWVRGQTGSLALMAAGEFCVDCGMYLHTSSRALRRDPNMPIKVIVPEDIVAVSFHEPEAVYARAQHPHAGFCDGIYRLNGRSDARRRARDPGKASFVGEGTLAGKIMQGRKISRCDAVCRNQEDK